MARAWRVLAVSGLAFLAIGAGQGRRPVAEATAITESPNVRAGATMRAAFRVSVPDEIHIQSNKPRDPSLIAATLILTPPSGVTWTEVVYPSATDFKVLGFDEPLAVFAGSFDIGVQLAVAKSVPPGRVTVPAKLRYQACNDTTCFPPTSVEAAFTFEVVGPSATVAAERADVFRRIAFGRGSPPPVVAAAEPSAASTTGPTAGQPAAVASAGGVATANSGTDVVAQFDRFTIQGTSGYAGVDDFLEFIDNAERGIKPRGMFDGRGPIAILALVFLGGLALNLTPCVLPMIPINLAIIGAGSQRSNRGRGFMLGATYGAAMALAYGVLGLVVILTAGTFGTINSSPWFNFGIAALFVVLGLAMFDIVPLDPSRLSSRIRFDSESRGTFVLAFTMGAVAAVLAGACVAPVVIQVVVYASSAYVSGNHLALALPFVLGLGMALPWPLAGAGLAALPKPGAWMERVKQGFGVFILATAAYYGYLAYDIWSARWVDPASVTASVEQQVKAGWRASLAEGLAIAERDRTPVLIDFWASWCKNCLVMDRTTLADPRVTAALAKYTLIKFQAEDLDAMPARALLQRIGAVGLPAYVIARPK